jgi:hypothetical protein
MVPKIPTYQPMYRVDSSLKDGIEEIQRVLKSKAREGELLMSESSFRESLSSGEHNKSKSI